MRRRAAAFAFVLASGCASPAGEPTLRSTRGSGFLVQDDGSLDTKEMAALFSELATSRERLVKLLGSALAPGDFRSPEQRAQASCPLAPPLETRVLVLSGGGRCHADETGITLLHSHLERRDATHELVHYLAGGSWRPIDEGLAVWLTEKLQGPSWGVSVDVRSRVYLDLGMDEGLERDRIRLGMTRRDYDLAGSFVKYLVDEKGWETFAKLYRGASGDFHGVYGVPEQELVARWREKIMKLAVRQNASYYRFKDHLTSLRSGR